MHPQHMLSVNKSASKSKRRSGDQKVASGDRQACQAVPARARAAQLNPRQLNFNDEMVEADHNKIVFEDVDASEAVAGEEGSIGNSKIVELQDHDEDHFQVVKIKFNHENQHKSRQALSQHVRFVDSAKKTPSSKSTR